MDELGLLIFPSFEGAARLVGLDPATAPADIIANEQVRAALCQRMAAYNRDNPGSSNRIARVLLLAEPPNVDAGEITDKGYINQRTVLDRRAGEVARLYAGGPGVMLMP
jgi:feruloyl-CoA synthase